MRGQGGSREKEDENVRGRFVIQGREHINTRTRCPYYRRYCKSIEHHNYQVAHSLGHSSSSKRESHGGRGREKDKADTHRKLWYISDVVIVVVSLLCFLLSFLHNFLAGLHSSCKQSFRRLGSRRSERLGSRRAEKLILAAQARMSAI